jgi:acid phosphatase
LDDTVVDDSAFETFLYENNLEYTDELWADYEANYPQDVGLVPGAKEFIKTAESLGVAVVFISNRSELSREATERALERLGINAAAPPGRLYLRQNGGSSDKSARRETVAAKYNVLMCFGDSLRDFSESFAAQKLPRDATAEEVRKGIERRASLVEEAACHWGVDWFVLPNPVYGDWERLIGPDPKAVLHPTSMKMKTASR